jgi:rubrerythrin
MSRSTPRATAEATPQPCEVTATITRHADGSLGPIRHSAALACPSCGHTFTGDWPPGRDTAGIPCPSCGTVAEVTWPGFTFEPETVVERTGQ